MDIRIKFYNYITVIGISQCKNDTNLCDTGKVWVMKSRYRYGLWGFTELWDFPANGVGGCQKPWVIKIMGCHRDGL